MPNLNKDALDIWNALRPMIDKEIERRTRGTVQRKKAKVTTAPSLVTNKIGVTEPFGDQYFIPFNTNLSTAKVGDVVWVEFMYGATNAFASMYATADTKDVTVGGVLDVVQRRCSATLSSAGWYRVMQTKDVSGTIIDFRIGRPYDANPAEAHKISFHIVGGGKSAFLDETSDTNTLCVDKIRATYGGGFMYFDVHYNTSSANEVLVYFDVYGKGQANGTSIAMGLASVADAPAGETVLTTYTFRANYNPTMVDIWSAVTLNYSELRKDVRIQGGMVHIFIETYFDGYQADYEYTLGSVSSPYRPLYPVFFTGHTVDANFNPKGLVTFIIYSDGTMTVRINNTNGNYLILNATYTIF